MIKEIRNIFDFSVLDQGTPEDIYKVERVVYQDDLIGEGGFGRIYKVNSIDGKYFDNLLLKIYFDKEHNNHSFDTIRNLHVKLKRVQTKTGIPIYLDYPELLGLPFIAFRGKEDVANEEVVGFIMYDLTKLQYHDFGAEDASSLEIDIYHSLVFAFQFSKVVNFLHSLNFYHADLKEDSIFLNLNDRKLSLIDFDSGYHSDIQEKPITVGAISPWRRVGFFVKKLFNLNSKEEDTLKVKYEEYWILSNAIFQFISKLRTPYIFLKESDDSLKSKYLEKYRWPEVGKSKNLFREDASSISKGIENLLEDLESNGLGQIKSNLVSCFNEGLTKNEAIPTANRWMGDIHRMLSELEYRPEIHAFDISTDAIDKPNQPIAFKWKAEKYNYIKVNGLLYDFRVENAIISVIDEGPLLFEFVNDFFTEKKNVFIKANKKVPKILLFEASEYLRSTSDPVKLYWKVEDAESVQINQTENKVFDGVLEVYPIRDTIYELKARGFFGEILSDTLEVKVIKPEIIEFSYSINLDFGIDNVDLKWETENSDTVEIQPSLGYVDTIGSAHVSLNGETTFTLIAKGLFQSTAKVISAKPFPVPIINEIMAEYPKISLEIKVTPPPLQIPDPLLQMSQINFINNIAIILNTPDQNVEEFKFNRSLPDFNLNLPLVDSTKNENNSLFKAVMNKIQEMKQKIFKL